MAEQPQIPSLDGLTELAKRDGVDIKPTLLRVMTDLYVQKPVHSIEEERHYIELAVRLIDQVDAATRSIVAARLVKYPRAPLQIADHLWRVRIQRGETEPEAVLASAQAPSPAPTVPAPLPTPAAESAGVEAPSAAELSDVFLSADAQERRMILLHLDLAALPPAPPAGAQVEQDTIRRLEMAALNHNSDGFAQEIERTLGIAKSYTRRLIDDQSGEPMLVLARALGMPADVLQRILLCLNPAISHSVLRVYELSTLYDEIERQSALRLIAIWQAAHRPAQRRAAQPAHQPQHYDEGRIDRGLPVRPKIRWDEHTHRREDGAS